MARATLPTYLEIAASAAFPVWIDREPVGHLLVALDDEDVPRARVALTAAETQGVHIRPLDVAELREVEPAVSPGAVAGWLLDQGHRLDPAALTVALALAAKAASADVRHHVRVRAFVHDGDAIRGIVTDDGPVHADTVIVAAGPWSTALLDPIGVRLAITGARGWIVRVRPASGTLRHMVEHAGWRVAPERLADVAPPSAGSVAMGGMPEAEVGAVLHLHADGSVLVGSSRQPWLTPEPEEPEVPQRILRAGIRLAPSLADATVTSTWWGLRPMTPDERPFVGTVRDGLVVATGHGSEGVILGAGTAQLAASIVLGGLAPFDAAPFDPFRFVG